MPPLFLRLLISAIFLIIVNETLAFNEELVILFAFANFFVITVYGSSRLLESFLNENLTVLKSNLVNHKHVYFGLILLLSNSLKLFNKVFHTIDSTVSNFIQDLVRFEVGIVSIYFASNFGKQSFAFNGAPEQGKDCRSDSDQSSFHFDTFFLLKTTMDFWTRTSYFVLTNDLAQFDETLNFSVFGRSEAEFALLCSLSATTDNEQNNA